MNEFGHTAIILPKLNTVMWSLLMFLCNFFLNFFLKEIILLVSIFSFLKVSYFQIFFTTTTDSATQI